MIITVPAVTPFTMPVVEPTVAFPLLALHWPPGVALLNGMVEPTHTLLRPPMDAGKGLTVTVLQLEHPVLVYV